MPQGPLQQKIGAESENAVFWDIYETANNAAARKKLLTHLVRLRKIAQHPVLVMEDEKFGMKYMHPHFTVHDVLRGSPKFEVLDRILPKLLLSKRRVVIFSQFKGVLDLISMYLQAQDVAYLRLDSDMDNITRTCKVDAFMQGA